MKELGSWEGAPAVLGLESPVSDTGALGMAASFGYACGDEDLYFPFFNSSPLSCALPGPRRFRLESRLLFHQKPGWVGFLSA